MKRIFLLALFALSLIILSSCNKAIEPENSNNSKTTVSISSAELISEKNRHLIGTMVQDYSQPKVSTKEPTSTSNNSKTNNDLSLFGSSIVKKVNSVDILEPNSIVEFEAKNKITPEIIMTNGNAAVFTNSNNTGWICEKGDVLSYAFEKYSSDASDSQTLIIGYILDGVLYSGEEFKELSGTYQFKVNEGGEYYIYLISATSDYLALKQGAISISK